MLMNSEHPAVVDLVDRIRARSVDRSPAAMRAAIAAELRAQARSLDPVRDAALGDGFDAVGLAYEALLPGPERRVAGQFQTPLWAADLMAGWLLQEPTELLADPGVGSGRLLFRAAERPETSPAAYLGLDIDPLALAMSRANFRLRGIGSVRLRRRNFLLDPLRERPDALTCNPPYSRHHAIQPTEKEAIHRGFEERLGIRFSRLASLHALFLVRALEVLADGGRMAFITPAEWLDVNYGQRIKAFLLDQAHVEAIIFLPEDQLFFDGALTTAAITLIRKERSAVGAQIIRLPPHQPPVDKVLERLNRSARRLRLRPDQKWSRRAQPRAGGRPLDDLARIRRGVATGCNRFFVLSEAARQEHRLRRAWLRPCLTSPRLVEGTTFTEADWDALPASVPRWILDCRDPTAEGSTTALGRYVRHGRAIGVSRGYLAEHRRPWYALEGRRVSPILFTYMNRAQPRFIRNEINAVPLNTFLIIEPEPGVDPDQLASALNSPHVFRQLEGGRRMYGGGLWKLEPGELGQLRVRVS
jgi:adenine-specific DNA-methyltransferase